MENDYQFLHDKLLQDKPSAKKMEETLEVCTEARLWECELNV